MPTFKSIYSDDGEVLISVRKQKRFDVIQLRKRGEKFRVSTKKKVTQLNLLYYKTQGIKAYQEVIDQKEKEANQPKDLKFNEFAPIALKYINRAVGKNTKEDRESRTRRYLFPFFGKKKLRDITSLHVEQWQDNMLILNSADKTKRTKQLLRQILDRALVHKLVDTNVVKATSTIREPRSDDREVYTKDEIKKMLDNSEGWLNLFIFTMVSVGLRSGEMIGLKFSDIDFNERTIKVQRSIRMGVISTPKSGISRVVEIPTSLYKRFEIAYQHKQPKQEYIFLNSKNSYWGDCSSIIKRHFKPLLERIGVKYRTLYSLRHTYATLSLQGGQKINYVSKQLGHKDTTTTLQYYVKYLKDDKSIERADTIFAF
ncbi:MAG: site-specific integrase [Sulfurovaceae bacterium]|nr:site-specific integrase [Sulfurovaceae bacterium]